MTKPRVLISDKMDPNAAKIFEERGCQVDVITGETPEQLIARIGDYDGLAIRSATKASCAPILLNNAPICWPAWAAGMKRPPPIARPAPAAARRCCSCGKVRPMHW